MKRKGVIVVVIIMIIVVLGIYLWTRPTRLGNMTHAFSEPATSTSEISFPGESGERIRFSFRSNIEDGELEMRLYDSEGKMVYELDHAKALETYYTFEQSDTYTLIAEYDDFVGYYKIGVFEAN